MLVAERMTYGFRERPDFLQALSLTAGAGQCWGIIGPNGAGKSTLLRLLAGLQVPSSGQVLFRGSPLATMPMNRRATQIAFLPQQLSEALGTTAVDVVLMGRYPHRRFGLFEDAADRAIADSAMGATSTLAFAERQMSTLSGGEARRVHIAAALAQQPSLLLLDEPTAALDLYHQLSIFEILTKLAAEEGLLVMVVTHDINLAARFCTLDGTLEESIRGTDATIPFEIQIKTIAQETWGEYTHDISYARTSENTDVRFYTIRLLQKALADHLDVADQLQSRIEHLAQDALFAIASELPGTLFWRKYIIDRFEFQRLLTRLFPGDGGLVGRGQRLTKRSRPDCFSSLIPAGLGEAGQAVFDV